MSSSSTMSEDMHTETSIIYSNTLDEICSFDVINNMRLETSSNVKDDDYIRALTNAEIEVFWKVSNVSDRTRGLFMQVNKDTGLTPIYYKLSLFETTIQFRCLLFHCLGFEFSTNMNKGFEKIITQITYDYKCDLQAFYKENWREYFYITIPVYPIEKLIEQNVKMVRSGNVWSFENMSKDMEQQFKKLPSNIQDFITNYMVKDFNVKVDKTTYFIGPNVKGKDYEKNMVKCLDVGDLYHRPLYKAYHKDFGYGYWISNKGKLLSFIQDVTYVYLK